jgi:transcriptional regulator with XRE-family HTH domain
MAYADERRMAEQAMEARDDEARQFPPTAARFGAALQRAGLSASELAVRCGVTRTLYLDLELYDSEVFDCVDVAELPRIGEILGIPLLELLFGAQPERIARVSYADVVAAIREEAGRRKIGLDAFGDSVGWDLERLTRDPEAVGELNLTGLYDVCRAVGLDWIGVLMWAEERGRRTRG